MKISDYQKYLSDKDNNEELDLSKYINIFIRRKTFFAISTFLITLSGVIYTMLKEPVYRGYFQIIVENKVESGLIKESQILKTLNNYIGDDNSNNKTQEAILKSPLVLKPVFEFFQNQKPILDNPKKISYKKWLSKYLKIEFENGTNVLSIKFYNEDKDLIISTLNLISKSYQNYSMNDRENSIRNGIEYLEYQKSKYKEKSLKSLKKLNDFSIKNGLIGDIDGIVNFENKIEDEDQSFENNFKKNDSNIGLRYASQFKMLEDNEAKLLELSARLKPNSKTLSNLKIKIKNLKEFLKRPNQILLEFRELNRLAKRDETFLANIEEDLGILKLEQVKQLNPWQLITEPTIDDEIVSPKRNRIIIISFITSLILSGFLCIYKENKEGVIYEIEDFYKIIPFKLEDIFFKRLPNLNQLIIKNIFNNIQSKEKLVGLIILNSNFLKGIELVKPEYLLTKYKFKIIDINSLEDLEKLEKIIILAEPGEIKFSELHLIISFLKTFDSKKFSWIYVNSKLIKY